MLWIVASLFLLTLNTSPSVHSLSPTLAVNPESLDVHPGQTACFAVFTHGTYEGALRLSIIASFPSMNWSVTPPTMRSGEAAVLMVKIPPYVSIPGEYNITLNANGTGLELSAIIRLHVEPLTEPNMVVDPSVFVAGVKNVFKITFSPSTISMNLRVVEVPSGKIQLLDLVGRVQEIAFIPQLNTTHLVFIMSAPDLKEKVAILNLKEYSIPTTTTTMTTTVTRTTTAALETTPQPIDLTKPFFGTILVAALLASAVIMVKRKQELRSKSTKRIKPSLQTPSTSRCTMCSREITTKFCPHCGTRQ